MAGSKDESLARGTSSLTRIAGWLYIAAILLYYASLHVTEAWQVIAFQAVTLGVVALAAAGLRGFMAYVIVAVMVLNIVAVLLVAAAYPEWDWTIFDPWPPGLQGLAMLYMMVQVPLTPLLIFAALVVPVVKQWKASSRRT